MNSLGNVATELKEIFESIMKGYTSYTFSMMITNKGIKDLSQRLYETLFHWITDPIQTPDSIIYMLETYLPGLDGFSTKKGSQNLVAFFCLRALAKRRPVLDGLWEDVIFIIKEYSQDFFLTPGKSLVNAKKDGEKWLEDIQKLCSPEQCPNPWLGLEIIRLTRLFSPVFGKLIYDRVSLRELVINTFCHMPDNLNQSTMSIHDLKEMMEDNSIDIESIIQRDYPKSRQLEIIGAVVKITEMFAALETNSQDLALYLHFGGLISSGIDHRLHIQYFIKAVCDKPTLVHYVIDTYNVIKDGFDNNKGELCDDGDPLYYETVLRDYIFRMFNKYYVSICPRQQFLREVNGGITPAAEHRVRYFSDYQYHQSSGFKAKNNSENSTTDESDDSEYNY